MKLKIYLPELVFYRENAKKRPDFVVLENSTLSTFTSDKYIEDSEVIDGYDELLIIELKRGGSEIGLKEKFQTLEYAQEFVDRGYVSPTTKITCYLLGSTVDSKQSNANTDGNIIVKPKQYDLLIKTAKNRTFNLINKIKSVKGITDIGDAEINEVLRGDESQNTLARGY